ncbi:MAG: hypothetical protein NVS1B10_03250 [Candidatus Saccharimonadales bacterium]
MPDYRSPYQEANDKQYSMGNAFDSINQLSQMLQKKQLADQVQRGEDRRQQAGFQQQKDMLPLESANKLGLMQGESDVKLKESRARLQDVITAAKNAPAGAGVSEGAESASITRQPNMGVYDLKKSQFDQTQANKYSKGLEKYSDLTGAAADLERITNRDGKGGVFTNPEAKLSSAGKMISALPDAALGAMEMMGVIPKGSADERKAIARFRQGVGVSLGGARGMSPAIQQGIKESLGGMTSGDPQLMSKGLRGAARIVGGSVKTVQGGFAPEVRGMVHDNMGGDPMDFYGKISADGGPPANYNSPPAGVKDQMKQSQPAQPQAPQGMATPGGGFDPDKYLGK